jgi:uncharacterized protein YdhG (YjbR/CyaY superfamily)
MPCAPTVAVPYWEFLRKPLKFIQMKASPAADIDAYLAAVPEPAHSTLQQLREMIRAAAPEAVEIISYQIPTFKLHYNLVGFAAFPRHCSFFVMSPPLMEKLKPDLEGYKTAMATIQFPLDRCLPKQLVHKIVKARIQENETRMLAKKKK